MPVKGFLHAGAFPGRPCWFTGSMLRVCPVSFWVRELLDAVDPFKMYVMFDRQERLYVRK